MLLLLVVLLLLADLLTDSWYLTIVSRWPSSCDRRPMQRWLFILHLFFWFMFTHSVWYMRWAAAFHRLLRSSSLIYRQNIIARYCAAKVWCCPKPCVVLYIAMWQNFKFKYCPSPSIFTKPEICQIPSLVFIKFESVVFIIVNYAASKALLR